MPETTANETNKRVRVNVSLSAKGVAQWDITAEFDDGDKSIEELSKTIDKVRALLNAKGIPEAGAVA